MAASSAAAAAAAGSVLVGVPSIRASSGTGDNCFSRKPSVINSIQPRRLPVLSTPPFTRIRSVPQSKRWPHEATAGGSVTWKGKNSACGRRNSLPSGQAVEARLSEQCKTFSCMLNPRRLPFGSGRSTPGLFFDKSKPCFPGRSLDGATSKGVQVAYASVGPNEPHAASTACPDGILEKQDSDVFYSELGRAGVTEFLSSKLPSHTILHRGQLRNGLRYLILPNKVRPNRFEAHTEVHVVSIDEEDDEQGIAHMIEHVAFLGSKKREKVPGPVLIQIPTQICIIRCSTSIHHLIQRVLMEIYCLLYWMP